MLWLDRLELNNKVWFRKLVRALGGELVPNFDVEELYVILGYDCGTTRRLVVIGDDGYEYEAYDAGSKPVFIAKGDVDINGHILKVVYKDINHCTVVCMNRAVIINEISKTITTKFECQASEDNDLYLDMFEKEVENYMKFGNVLITGSEGMYLVTCIYLASESKMFNKIKAKYDRKLHP